eukprot:Amastigsp_a845035_27.p5 type:complete len:114 gc:universal Amastigsp_a845035_27:1011-670(-)
MKISMKTAPDSSTRRRAVTRDCSYGAMAETMTTEQRAACAATNPMRSTLVMRSSLVKPRPLERCVRATSPSSIDTWRSGNWRRAGSSACATVVFPEPESPVKNSTTPRLRMGG